MKTIASLLYSFLSLCLTAHSDILVYRLTSAEHVIGGGQDFRYSVRGVLVIDLVTFDISIFGASTIRGQKVMSHQLHPEVDIRELQGANGQTHTLFSIFEDRGDTDPISYNLSYARGLDASIEWAPGMYARWPIRWTVAGPSVSLAPLNVTESVISMAYLRASTVQANGLGLSRAEFIDSLKNDLLARGYIDVSQ